jgi:hypothetical protein
MRHAIALIALATLVGCATTAPQGPAAWGYQPGQAAPSRISEAEAETLTSQYLEFKLKRDEIARVQAATSDPNGRARYGQMIDELSQSMAPLEYRLRAAGRPVP